MPRTFCSSMSPASLRLMRPISKNSRYDTATRCIRRGADIGPPSGERVTARGKQPWKRVVEKIDVFALAQIGQRVEAAQFGVDFSRMAHDDAAVGQSVEKARK